MRRAALLGLALLAPAGASAFKLEKLSRVAANGQARAVDVVAETAFVRFSSGTPLAQKQAALAAVGASIKKDYPRLGWTMVNLPSGVSVPSGLTLLGGLPGVLAAEPDYAYKPVLLPNDPGVPSQYGLSQVNAFSAWEFGTGSGSQVTTIAVVDSGVESTHPDFAGKMAGLAHQYCEPAGSGCVADGPTVACFHGTSVAGVAAASGNNGTAVAGLNWGAKILSLRVFDAATCTDDCGDEAGPGCVTDDGGVADAITFATTLVGNPLYGKIVLNLSLGGAGVCNGAVQAAMATAVGLDIPVIVAAGNDGGAVNSPGNCASAIPVGATDSLNNITAFSSRGPELAANGLVAPGKTVLTTMTGGGTASVDGTSFSAPHVAGVASLMLAANPGLTAPQVKTFLRAGADGIGVSSLGTQQAVPQGNTSGAGRLNAFRSMKLAVDGTLAGFEGESKAIAFPNPFRLAQTGTVGFSIPSSLQGSGAQIKIFSSDGVLVRELDGLSWDGKNEHGKLVASGVYIFTVNTSAGKTRGRVAVIR